MFHEERKASVWYRYAQVNVQFIWNPDAAGLAAEPKPMEDWLFDLNTHIYSALVNKQDFSQRTHTFAHVASGCIPQC